MSRFRDEIRSTGTSLWCLVGSEQCIIKFVANFLYFQYPYDVTFPIKELYLLNKIQILEQSEICMPLYVLARSRLSLSFQGDCDVKELLWVLIKND